MAAGLDGLVRNIGIISRNNSVLASMLSHLDAGEEPTEPRELRVLLQDTGHIARETGALLLNLQHDVGRDESRQRSMLAKLNKDFQFVLRRFQQLAEQCNDLESGGSARGGGGSSGSNAQSSLLQDDDDDDDNERSSLLEADETRMRAQQRQVQRQSTEHLAEREKMISQVETTVGEVNEIFQELAGIVQEQVHATPTASQRGAAARRRGCRPLLPPAV